MVFANLGVSIPVFVLGLLLAFAFAVPPKDTPFALPPSGRLSAGVSVTPLAVAWGLERLTGAAPNGPRLHLEHVHCSTRSSPSSGPGFVDAVRHLILPAIAVGTIRWRSSPG